MSEKFPTVADPDAIGHNDSCNPEFDAILSARLSRRRLLGGGASAAALLFGGLSLSGCSDGGSDSPSPTPAPTPTPAPAFNFKPVAKSLADMVVLPAGYSASVLYAVGDPLFPGVLPYRNNGTDTDFERRAGDHHDGMEYFGLNAAGTARDDQGSERGLLGMNHENITEVFLHANGPSLIGGVRPLEEVNREIAAHGVSVVEVQKTAGRFRVNAASRYNRRITPQTPVEVAGPARGSALLRSTYSPDGLRARGTLNNCATGQTPWGTLLTCEENWAGYFARAAGDNLRRDANQIESMKRYGLSEGSNGSRWHTPSVEDAYLRFDIAVKGGSFDGSDDYRNEANTFGYVVEIDPYDPNAVPRKRTALGRFAHEAAVCPRPVAGQPVVFYMGDDARNEYIYKFVSKALWEPSDAARGGMAVGDKYLNEGTLYAARFNADGTGEWLPLTLTNPAIAAYTRYRFQSLADIVVNARLAADAAGATKMDRPEWCAINPHNNEVYYTLTNNSTRTLATLDAANPRAYQDQKGSSTQNGNVNGHIIRTRENGDHPAATAFRWDVYLFAAEAGAEAGRINLSGLTADNDMSSPDGVWFSRKTGVLWVQTDDGAYTDVSNCMMLAALPGRVGDGGAVVVESVSGSEKRSVTTYKGKNPTVDTLRRFLVGPKGCEITGCAETPDGRTLFVNIQHPGESTRAADLNDPSRWESHWPDGGNSRPRSATIAIVRDDGGTIAVS
ncbi:PhoX family protein [Chitinimonas lacunae]|uniref:PhoX family protein n=1 Tax=Chitinimonas lacunae TaxID=1963018 RepID=A0ABV8MNG2_9NEIS